MDTKERLKILDLLWYLQINDMTRYVDIEVLINKVLPDDGGDENYPVNAKAVYEAIQKAPTEESLPTVSKTEQVRAEAVREIFEEIEKWLATDGTLLIITAKKFAEIKNKYMEE